MKTACEWNCYVFSLVETVVLSKACMSLLFTNTLWRFLHISNWLPAVFRRFYIHCFQSLNDESKPCPCQWNGGSTLLIHSVTPGRVTFRKSTFVAEVVRYEDLPTRSMAKTIKTLDRIVQTTRAKTPAFVNTWKQVVCKVEHG